MQQGWTTQIDLKSPARKETERCRKPAGQRHQLRNRGQGFRSSALAFLLPSQSDNFSRKQETTVTDNVQ